MSQLGSPDNPLRVAIIGSGPSGFYATEALLKSGITVKIDMLERLPAPYGLVRNGVAPDHQKLKQVIQLYDKIAEAKQFNFLGNVTAGRDITIAELKNTHHAIIFACGAESDRKLGIPGENLHGSHTATEFVGWYNGHPDYCDREFDLSHETAVIIGQGNVAADVARILAKTVDELMYTDIAQYALEELAESKIREIQVIGRRGPAQAKFTPKELREFGELSGCNPVVAVDDLVLNSASQKELADKSNVGNLKIYELFKEYSERPPSSKMKRCYFRFLLGPVELRGPGRLQTVVLEKNSLSGEPMNQYARGTGEKIEMEAGILFRSIGYKGVPLPGLPFDDKLGIIPNTDGRIMENGTVQPGLYAAGWIKRGPTGIIGTNRADSVATIGSLLADVNENMSTTSKPGADALLPILRERKVHYVTFPEWKKIDAQEVELGKPKSKPREKFTTVKDMLSVIE
jgi:NADPH-dependent glutamate synthase beta chain and related oxidoreductases